MKKSATKIFIATPNHVHSRSEVATQKYGFALASFARRYPDIQIRTGTTATSLLAVGYQQLYNDAKKFNADWFLTIEADMILEPHTLWKLYEIAQRRKFAHIAALYFMNDLGEPYPLLLYQADKSHPLMPKWVKEYPYPLYNFVPDFPQNTIVSVDATGLGCTLISMAALQDVEIRSKEHTGNLFQVEFTERGRAQYSVDVALSYLLKQCGYDLHVHTGLQCGHISRIPRIIDQTYYQRRYFEAWNNPNWQSDFDKIIQMRKQPGVNLYETPEGYVREPDAENDVPVTVYNEGAACA